jgi:hypothetical protein
MRYAALLKGVNVGGNRKLPMADLKAFVAGLGFGGVQTLLASGNVVFAADGDAAALEALLADEAKVALGLDTPWFVRSHADLAAVVAANPFPEAARAAEPPAGDVSSRRVSGGVAGGAVGVWRAGASGVRRARTVRGLSGGDRAVDAAPSDGEAEIPDGRDCAELEYGGEAGGSDRLISSSWARPRIQAATRSPCDPGS